MMTIATRFRLTRSSEKRESVTAGATLTANNTAIDRRLLELGHPERLHLLEGLGGSKYALVAEQRADDLQPHGQPCFGEPGGHRDRRLLGQVERIGKRRPIVPFTAVGLRRIIDAG